MSNKNYKNIFSNKKSISLFLYCLYCSINYSQALTVTVPSGVSGIIGYTEYTSGTLSGTQFSDQASSRLGFPVISSDRTICTTSSTQGISRGFSGRYGYTLYNSAGNTTGAVLLVDGTGSWSRTAGDGTLINGNVIFTSGIWRNNWSYPILGKTSLSSNANGTFQNSVTCPSVTDIDTPIQTGVWRQGAPKRSSVNIRFALDAPRGGITAGRYSLLLPIYMIDFDSGNKLDRLITRTVNVRVANYACTLNTNKNTIALNSADEQTMVDSLIVTSSCQDRGNDSAILNANLSIDASGVSRGVSSDPQILGVPNSDDKLQIRGSWGTTPPTCNASDMYFDNRDGPLLGALTPNGIVNFEPKTLSFRLCNNGATPGNYRAQAVVSIVTK